MMKHDGREFVSQEPQASLNLMIELAIFPQFLLKCQLRHYWQIDTIFNTATDNKRHENSQHLAGDLRKLGLSFFVQTIPRTEGKLNQRQEVNQ